MFLRVYRVYAGVLVAVPGDGKATNDSAAVASTVERLHNAGVAGDSALALSLLTPDAIVFESGGMETCDEFRARHGAMRHGDVDEHDDGRVPPAPSKQR